MGGTLRIPEYSKVLTGPSVEEEKTLSTHKVYFSYEENKTHLVLSNDIREEREGWVALPYIIQYIPSMSS